MAEVLPRRWLHMTSKRPSVLFFLPCHFCCIRALPFPFHKMGVYDQQQQFTAKVEESLADDAIRLRVKQTMLLSEGDV